MPRPASPKDIRKDLTERTIKPQGIPMSDLEVIEVPLEGLEALRLADIEGLYQEEAARRMGVSRATFARVLTQARRAVAEGILTEKAIAFTGGDFRPRPARSWPCPVHGGQRRRGRGCRCRRGSRHQQHEQGERHAQS
jgi:predicted DNA-binding protein (UPF0251 family)